MPQGDEAFDFERWRQYGLVRGWLKDERGPRSIKRSDDSIESEIYDKLRHNRDLDASEIEVEVNRGNVVLKGYIDTKYERNLAEEIVESIYGVRDIMNQLQFKQFGFQAPKQ